MRRAFTFVTCVALTLAAAFSVSRSQGQGKATVLVTWDANWEADLAGYRVYHGTQPRSYLPAIDMGNRTECRIGNLNRNRRWYFAVTAYDTALNESGFSEEVSIYLDGDDTVGVGPDRGCYNFPNPFNPELERTYIRYRLTKERRVTVTVHDRGERVVRRLADELRPAGEHFQIWDGRDDRGYLVANGIYLAVVSFGGTRMVVKVAVIR